jgi:hypothetical protein
VRRIFVRIRARGLVMTLVNARWVAVKLALPGQESSTMALVMDVDEVDEVVGFSERIFPRVVS